MKKVFGFVALILAITLGFSGVGHSSSGYLGDFNTRYGTSATALNSCTVCHTSPPALNPYGNAWVSNGYDFAAIESLDSDGDGFSNLAEIQARTFPGDPASKPAASDTTAPTVTGFTVPAASTSLTVSISAFSATDTVGVTGYMVTESAAAPAASASGWSATAPTSYTFATAGAKTLYAWAKDAAGNVSASRSAAVTVTVAVQDTAAPTIASFTLPAASTTLSVTITSFTATDNVGVTGYMVKESATAPTASTAGWTAGVPGSYSFATAGAKTLYAWVKDAAGNISAVQSATVNINTTTGGGTGTGTGSGTGTGTGTGTNPPAGGGEAAGDLALWAGKWFKTKIRFAGYFHEDSRERDGHESDSGYLKIENWDPVTRILEANLHGVENGKWWVMPLDLQYESGSPLEFEASAQATVEKLTIELTVKIKGEQRSGVLRVASIEALGKYSSQVTTGTREHEDDDDDSGWFKISGKLIPEANVPRNLVSQ